jgi:hypothetical protein
MRLHCLPPEAKIFAKWPRAAMARKRRWLLTESPPTPNRWDPAQPE